MRSLLHRKPPANPRKQRGVSLLNVVLGLGVFAAASVMTINMFTGTSDTSTNQAAVNEIASALTRADSHSAMLGRNCSGNAPSEEALFGDATNVYGQTITVACASSADDITITYPVTLPTQPRTAEACEYITDRINPTSFSSLNAFTGVTLSCAQAASISLSLVVE